MSGRILKLSLILTACLAVAGCQGGRRNQFSFNEPGLDPMASGAITDNALAAASPGPAWVERHPLFSKPRQYYANSDGNGVRKTAAATFIGVPAGIAGEMKQVVVGRPPAAAY